MVRIEVKYIDGVFGIGDRSCLGDRGCVGIALLMVEIRLVVEILWWTHDNEGVISCSIMLTL